jgi:hypothetical protein
MRRDSLEGMDTLEAIKGCVLRLHSEVRRLRSVLRLIEADRKDRERIAAEETVRTLVTSEAPSDLPNKS